MQLAGGNGGWFSVRVYSLSLCLKRPTTRQQKNARAPLATQRKNSFGAQHAPRGCGVGLVHLELNSNPQHTGALSVPMRLPKLPSYNNNRAEKSFQTFKFSDSKPRMERLEITVFCRTRKCGKKVILSVYNSQTMISPSKAAMTCYYSNQSAPAYTWQSTSKRTGEPPCNAKAQQCEPNALSIKTISRTLTPLDLQISAVLWGTR